MVFDEPGNVDFGGLASRKDLLKKVGREACRLLKGYWPAGPPRQQQRPIPPAKKPRVETLASSQALVEGPPCRLAVLKRQDSGGVNLPRPWANPNAKPVVISSAKEH